MTMVLAILGFLLSSVIFAIFLAYKITGDIHPTRLKRFLYRVIIKNWKEQLPARLGSDLHTNVCNAKTTDETGIFALEQEREAERPVKLTADCDADGLIFYGIDESDNAIVVRVTKCKKEISIGDVYIKTQGRHYTGSTLDSKCATDFGAGMLKLELVEPLRCWRIWYNGSLRDESTKENVHVKLNFLWKPLHECRDSQKNANHYLISNQLSELGKLGSHSVSDRLLRPGYSQFGSLHGIVKVEDACEDELYLYGYRVRKQTSVDDDRGGHTEVFAMSHSNGMAFRLSSDKGLWTTGEFQHVDGKYHDLTSAEVTAQSLENRHTIPKLFTLKNKKSNLRVEVWPKFTDLAVGAMEIGNLSLTINSVPATGLILLNLTRIQSSAVMELQLHKLGHQHQNTELPSGVLPDMVNFTDKQGLDVSLTGGKGASLCAIARFCETNNKPFSTAKGFCVTTAFFRKNVDLTYFEKIFKSAEGIDDLEDACRRVQQEITDNGLADRIESLVNTWVLQVFPDHKTIRFAVRSSGTLEDGSDLSCAGQNKTVLGVIASDVAKSIVVCWASLFTYQSVSYRLNHGQPAVSDMGVVVQEMVEAEAAGVLFTANPISGTPFQMLINANYGLGESVVSASCDPDTILLKRSRDESNAVTVEDIKLGDKKSKLVMDAETSGCVVGVPVDGKDSGRCCIDDSTAIKLGKIGLQLLKDNCDKPLDIEWAVVKGNIYILQSRNITSLDAWTDFEIVHELDTALRTKFERITDANTGEVMPGASSPLGLSTITRVLDFAIQARMEENEGDRIEATCVRTVSISRQRLLLQVIQMFYRHVEKEISAANIAADLSICGHKVINEDMHRLAVERWGLETPLSKARSIWHMIKLQRRQQKDVDAAEKRYSKYEFDFGNVKDDPKALLKRIKEELMQAIDICKIHCAVTEGSSGSQIIAFLILASGRKLEDWDAQLYTDLSKMLSVSKGVESADVPNAMNKFSDSIVSQGVVIVEQVIAATPSEALKVIQSHAVLSKEFDNFMVKHGHRSLRELDLAAKSWKQDPLPFISLVQSIVSSKSKFKGQWKSVDDQPSSTESSGTYDELLDSLKTPIDKNARRGLKFVLPYCQASVKNRERTKSLLVWTVCQLKLGFAQLSKLLVKHGLINDENLVNFLKFHEIEELIERSPNSARILYKALKRQKLYPSLQEEEFEEVLTGIPKPKDKFQQIEIGDTLKGTPVSSGKIQGTVKVCHNVDEASELLKPGDILITHGTDIAWSPFFPILGGVITELGGLISHGAVVAREYGLPCVVGAANATKFFNTGETVILDASQGLISKVK